MSSPLFGTTAGIELAARLEAKYASGTTSVRGDVNEQLFVPPELVSLLMGPTATAVEVTFTLTAAPYLPGQEGVGVNDDSVSAPRAASWASRVQTSQERASVTLRLRRTVPPPSAEAAAALSDNAPSPRAPVLAASAAAGIATALRVVIVPRVATGPRTSANGVGAGVHLNADVHVSNAGALECLKSTAPADCDPNSIDHVARVRSNLFIRWRTVTANVAADDTPSTTRRAAVRNSQSSGDQSDEAIKGADMLASSELFLGDPAKVMAPGAPLALTRLRQAIVTAATMSVKSAAAAAGVANSTIAAAFAAAVEVALPTAMAPLFGKTASAELALSSVTYGESLVLRTSQLLPGVTYVLEAAAFDLTTVTNVVSNILGALVTSQLAQTSTPGPTTLAREAAEATVAILTPLISPVDGGLVSTDAWASALRAAVALARPLHSAAVRVQLPPAPKHGSCRQLSLESLSLQRDADIIPFTGGLISAPWGNITALVEPLHAVVGIVCGGGAFDAEENPLEYHWTARSPTLEQAVAYAAQHINPGPIGAPNSPWAAQGLELEGGPWQQLPYFVVSVPRPPPGLPLPDGTVTGENDIVEVMVSVYSRSGSKSSQRVTITLPAVPVPAVAPVPGPNTSHYTVARGILDRAEAAAEAYSTVAKTAMKNADMQMQTLALAATAEASIYAARANLVAVALAAENEAKTTAVDSDRISTHNSNGTVAPTSLPIALPWEAEAATLAAVGRLFDIVPYLPGAELVAPLNALQYVAPVSEHIANDSSTRRALKLLSLLAEHAPQLATTEDATPGQRSEVSRAAVPHDEQSIRMNTPIPLSHSSPLNDIALNGTVISVETSNQTTPVLTTRLSSHAALHLITMTVTPTLLRLPAARARVLALLRWQLQLVVGDVPYNPSSGPMPGAPPANQWQDVRLRTDAAMVGDAGRTGNETSGVLGGSFSSYAIPVIGRGSRLIVEDTFAAVARVLELVLRAVTLQLEASNYATESVVTELLHDARIRHLLSEAEIAADSVAASAKTSSASKLSAMAASAKASGLSQLKQKQKSVNTLGPRTTTTVSDTVSKTALGLVRAIPGARAVLLASFEATSVLDSVLAAGVQLGRGLIQTGAPSVRLSPSLVREITCAVVTCEIDPAFASAADPVASLTEADKAPDFWTLGYASHPDTNLLDQPQPISTEAYTYDGKPVRNAAAGGFAVRSLRVDVTAQTVTGRALRIAAPVRMRDAAVQLPLRTTTTSVADSQTDSQDAQPMFDALRVRKKSAASRSRMTSKAASTARTQTATATKKTEPVIKKTASKTFASRAKTTWTTTTSTDIPAAPHTLAAPLVWLPHSLFRFLARRHVSVVDVVLAQVASPVPAAAAGRGSEFISSLTALKTDQITLVRTQLAAARRYIKLGGGQDRVGTGPGGAFTDDDLVTEIISSVINFSGSSTVPAPTVAISNSSDGLDTRSTTTVSSSTSSKNMAADATANTDESVDVSADTSTADDSADTGFVALARGLWTRIWGASDVSTASTKANTGPRVGTRVSTTTTGSKYRASWFDPSASSPALNVRVFVREMAPSAPAGTRGLLPFLPDGALDVASALEIAIVEEAQFFQTSTGIATQSLMANRNDTTRNASLFASATVNTTRMATAALPHLRGAPPNTGHVSLPYRGRKGVLTQITDDAKSHNPFHTFYAVPTEDVPYTKLPSATADALRRLDFGGRFAVTYWFPRTVTLTEYGTTSETSGDSSNLSSNGSTNESPPRAFAGTSPVPQLLSQSVLRNVISAEQLFTLPALPADSSSTTTAVPGVSWEWSVAANTSTGGSVSSSMSDTDSSTVTAEPGALWQFLASPLASESSLWASGDVDTNSINVDENSISDTDDESGNVGDVAVSSISVQSPRVSTLATQKQRVSSFTRTTSTRTTSSADSTTVTATTPATAATCAPTVSASVYGLDKLPSGISIACRGSASVGIVRARSQDSFLVGSGVLSPMTLRNYAPVPPKQTMRTLSLVWLAESAPIILIALIVLLALAIVGPLQATVTLDLKLDTQALCDLSTRWTLLPADPTNGPLDDAFVQLATAVAAVAAAEIAAKEKTSCSTEPVTAGENLAIVSALANSVPHSANATNSLAPSASSVDSFSSASSATNSGRAKRNGGRSRHSSAVAPSLDAPSLATQSYVGNSLVGPSQVVPSVAVTDAHSLRSLTSRVTGATLPPLSASHESGDGGDDPSNSRDRPLASPSPPQQLRQQLQQQRQPHRIDVHGSSVSMRAPSDEERSRAAHSREQPATHWGATHWGQSARDGSLDDANHNANYDHNGDSYCYDGRRSAGDCEWGGGVASSPGPLAPPATPFAPDSPARKEQMTHIPPSASIVTPPIMATTQSRTASAAHAKPARCQFCWCLITCGRRTKQRLRSSHSLMSVFTRDYTDTYTSAERVLVLTTALTGALCAALWFAGPYGADILGSYFTVVEIVADTQTPVAEDATPWVRVHHGTGALPVLLVAACAAAVAFMLLSCVLARLYSRADPGRLKRFVFTYAEQVALLYHTGLTSVFTRMEAIRLLALRPQGGVTSGLDLIARGAAWGEEAIADEVADMKHAQQLVEAALKAGNDGSAGANISHSAEADDDYDDTFDSAQSGADKSSHRAGRASHRALRGSRAPSKVTQTRNTNSSGNPNMPNRSPSNGDSDRGPRGGKRSSGVVTRGRERFRSPNTGSRLAGSTPRRSPSASPIHALGGSGLNRPRRFLGNNAANGSVNMAGAPRASPRVAVNDNGRNDAPLPPPQPPLLPTTYTDTFLPPVRNSNSSNLSSSNPAHTTSHSGVRGIVLSNGSAPQQHQHQSMSNPQSIDSVGAWDALMPGYGFRFGVGATSGFALNAGRPRRNKTVRRVTLRPANGPQRRSMFADIAADRESEGDGDGDAIPAYGNGQTHPRGQPATGGRIPAASASQHVFQSQRNVRSEVGADAPHLSHFGSTLASAFTSDNAPPVEALAANATSGAVGGSDIVPSSFALAHMRAYPYAMAHAHAPHAYGMPGEDDEDNDAQTAQAGAPVLTQTSAFARLLRLPSHAWLRSFDRDAGAYANKQAALTRALYREHAALLRAAQNDAGSSAHPTATAGAGWADSDAEFDTTDSLPEPDTRMQSSTAAPRMRHPPAALTIHSSTGTSDTGHASGLSGNSSTRLSGRRNSDARRSPSAIPVPVLVQRRVDARGSASLATYGSDVHSSGLSAAQSAPVITSRSPSPNMRANTLAPAQMRGQTQPSPRASPRGTATRGTAGAECDSESAVINDPKVTATHIGPRGSKLRATDAVGMITAASSAEAALSGPARAEVYLAALLREHVALAPLQDSLVASYTAPARRARANCFFGVCQRSSDPPVPPAAAAPVVKPPHQVAPLRVVLWVCTAVFFVVLILATFSGAMQLGGADAVPGVTSAFALLAMIGGVVIAMVVLEPIFYAIGAAIVTTAQLCPVGQRRVARISSCTRTRLADSIAVALSCGPVVSPGPTPSLAIAAAAAAAAAANSGNACMNFNAVGPDGEPLSPYIGPAAAAGAVAACPLPSQALARVGSLGVDNALASLNSGHYNSNSANANAIYNFPVNYDPCASQTPAFGYNQSNELNSRGGSCAFSVDSLYDGRGRPPTAQSAAPNHAALGGSLLGAAHGDFISNAGGAHYLLGASPPPGSMAPSSFTGAGPSATKLALNAGPYNRMTASPLPGHEGPTVAAVGVAATAVHSGLSLLTSKTSLRARSLSLATHVLVAIERHGVPAAACARPWEPLPLYITQFGELTLSPHAPLVSLEMARAFAAEGQPTPAAALLPPIRLPLALCVCGAEGPQLVPLKLPGADSTALPKPLPLILRQLAQERARSGVKNSGAECDGTCLLSLSAMPAHASLSLPQSLCVEEARRLTRAAAARGARALRRTGGPVSRAVATAGTGVGASAMPIAEHRRRNKRHADAPLPRRAAPVARVVAAAAGGERHDIAPPDQGHARTAPMLSFPTAQDVAPAWPGNARNNNSNVVGNNQDGQLPVHSGIPGISLAPSVRLGLGARLGHAHPAAAMAAGHPFAAVVNNGAGSDSFALHHERQHNLYAQQQQVLQQQQQQRGVMFNHVAIEHGYNITANDQYYSDGNSTPSGSSQHGSVPAVAPTLSLSPVAEATNDEVTNLSPAIGVHDSSTPRDGAVSAAAGMTVNFTATRSITAGNTAVMTEGVDIGSAAAGAGDGDGARHCVNALATAEAQELAHCLEQDGDVQLGLVQPQDHAQGPAHGIGLSLGHSLLGPILSPSPDMEHDADVIAQGEADAYPDRDRDDIMSTNTVTCVASAFVSAPALPGTDVDSQARRVPSPRGGSRPDREPAIVSTLGPTSGFALVSRLGPASAITSRVAYSGLYGQPGGYSYGGHSLVGHSHVVAGAAGCAGVLATPLYPPLATSQSISTLAPVTPAAGSTASTAAAGSTALPQSQSAQMHYRSLAAAPTMSTSSTSGLLAGAQPPLPPHPVVHSATNSHSVTPVMTTRTLAGPAKATPYHLNGSSHSNSGSAMYPSAGTYNAVPATATLAASPSGTGHSSGSVESEGSTATTAPASMPVTELAHVAVTGSQSVASMPHFSSAGSASALGSSHDLVPVSQSLPQLLPETQSQSGSASHSPMGSRAQSHLRLNSHVQSQSAQTQTQTQTQVQLFAPVLPMSLPVPAAVTTSARLTVGAIVAAPSVPPPAVASVVFTTASGADTGPLSLSPLPVSRAPVQPHPRMFHSSNSRSNSISDNNSTISVGESVRTVVLSPLLLDADAEADADADAESFNRTQGGAGDATPAPALAPAPPASVGTVTAKGVMFLAGAAPQKTQGRGSPQMVAFTTYLDDDDDDN